MLRAAESVFGRISALPSIESIRRASEDRIVVGRICGDRLEYVPIFDNFSVLIRAKNIDAGPIAVAGPCLVTAQKLEMSGQAASSDAAAWLNGRNLWEPGTTDLLAASA
jgi:hypothetical protein